jgi:transcriptional regulator with XRE-family HTH domain
MPKKYKSLADFLDQTGATQAEFAARVGVQQSLISRIVNGERTPSLPLAVRIASEASIPLESLVPGEEGAA